MTANDHGKASTYRNHKCRCDACREALRNDMARLRAKGALPSEKIRSKAQVLAVKWLIAAMPDVWQGFMDEAADQLGLDRQPIGRPPGGAA